MTMTVSPDDPAEMPVRPLADDHDAVLLLASLDPAFGAEHISGWATNAVVLVTAGKSSSTRIHAGRADAPPGGHHRPRRDPDRS